MITKLETALRRELSIQGKPYVLTVMPDGFLLAEKGRRTGFRMDWIAFVSGDAALAAGLAASLAGAPPPRRPASVSAPAGSQGERPPAPGKKPDAARPGAKARTRRS